MSLGEHDELKSKMEVISVDNHSIWDEIEHSESYLVCSMFDEAASSASSVLQRLCDENCSRPTIGVVELNDMLESAGMVLVQSLKELGRTLDILKELKLLFGSVAAIPIQVFITGVCFQVQEGFYDVREFLEEFLTMWEFVDEKYYVLSGAEGNIGNLGEWDNRFVLGVDRYLEVVEVYVVTLLALHLRDMELAISWVEKAAIPDQKRQELLRQLHSMCTDKVTSSSQANSTREQNTRTRLSNVIESQNLSVGDNNAKETIMRLSKQRVSGFGWFRNISLKFGDGRLVISSKSILLSCLLLLLYYVMRRKQANLRRTIRRQSLYVKKVVMDFWRLAFSYQVNPLAAVQPIPSASHGTR